MKNMITLDRHNKERIGPEIVDAYRLPQLVAGWEKGLVRFTTARMAGMLVILKPSCTV